MALELYLTKAEYRTNSGAYTELDYASLAVLIFNRFVTFFGEDGVPEPGPIIGAGRLFLGSMADVITLIDLHAGELGTDNVVDLRLTYRESNNTSRTMVIEDVMFGTDNFFGEVVAPLGQEEDRALEALGHPVEHIVPFIILMDADDKLADVITIT